MMNTGSQQYFALVSKPSKITESMTISSSPDPRQLRKGKEMTSSRLPLSL